MELQNAYTKNKDIDSGNRKVPMWNSFQDPPSKKLSGSSASWTKLGIVLKILKLCTYLIVFATILLTSVASRLSYVFMVAQLRGERRVQFCNINEKHNIFVVDLPQIQEMPWFWALIFAFAGPEVVTFFRSLRICGFKDIKAPTRTEVLLVTSFELLHVIGLGVFTFLILPQLDSTRAIMLCNCVCFVPTALSALIGLRLQLSSLLKGIINILCLAIQIISFALWAVLFPNIYYQLLTIPLLLISFRWWENYVNCYARIGYMLQTLRHGKSRYHIYLYLSPLKIIIFALVGFVSRGYSIQHSFSNFMIAWSPHKLIALNRTEHSKIDGDIEFGGLTTGINISTHTVSSSVNAIVYILLIQLISSYICYIFGKYACKIKIQKFSLSFPLCMSSPLSVALIMIISHFHTINPCAFHDYIPDYLSLNTQYGRLTMEVMWHLLSHEKLWTWFCWWLTQIWITSHIWRPRNERNAPTEKLFVCPLYCGILVEQCITMNRRIVDCSEDILLNKNDGEKKISTVTNSVASDVQETDSIPQVIVCATMWHETQDETMEFLKSIIRLDEDQCARRMAKLHINNGKPDEDYYELETNIFFDDAFISDPKLCENSKNPPINEYVKILITSIEKAAFEIYGVNMHIKPPVKIETPYGGRLVWTLPGRTKMIAHLKNKDKIRHKKRWSQVMYMYYLLGFRIMELDSLSPKRKALIADNTFLLALDGDIDFQPQAVHLLIDRMKAIDELGAACGRIHPVGRGPMVWYQIFEYAIGHWLQKATEHVIGCVLCSPGCFSLFRGSALMENSVMKKYTTVSQEPMHYVQYDQGEDRWLCTLILKQGLRVEYSAASDAYTHSPEMFNEFYNQRRRWVPSTIANIVDLLSDAKMVVTNNSSISTPYIIYQAMLMVGTILGPGTIFLMMVGSLVTVFSINIWTAFLWNFIPVLSFMLSCIYMKQKIQLLLAFVISSMYCLVMIAVLIGIIIQMIEDGPLAPASVFFLLVFSQIFIAGLVHPQEMGALVCGLIYYITIPSMYMLLMIYSVFNMNDVSWGTREAAPRKDDDNDTGNDVESNDYLPGWVNDPLLVDSQLGEISLKEKRFWKDLISLYLKPLFHTKEKKAEISDSLRELRNIFAFAFVMINAIFVLIVFLLQLKKDYLHLDWPIDPTDVIIYDDINSQIYVYRRYKELDPIGLCFVVFFGLILIIQFFAMFFHRFGTLSQLLATTHLDWFRSNAVTDEHAAQEISGNAVHIARQLQRPKHFGDDDSLMQNSDGQGVDDGESATRRQTIFKLHESASRNQLDYSDLVNNFERRFYAEDDIKVKHLSMSRKSLIMLNDTRHNAKNRLKQKVSFGGDFNKLNADDLIL